MLTGVTNSIPRPVAFTPGPKPISVSWFGRTSALMLTGVIGLLLSSCSQPAVSNTNASLIPQGAATELPEEWGMVIGTYRITYIAEVVERFGLQLEDLETIQVASVDPEPYESFPSRLDYDMTFATAISDCLADRGIAAPVIQAAEGPGVDVGINALRDPDFTRATGFVSWRLCLCTRLGPSRPRSMSGGSFMTSKSPLQSA